MSLHRTALLILLLPLAFLQAADNADLNKDDIAFIKKASHAGLIEVRSAEAALSRSLTTEEQSFARLLIADHKKANDELAAIAKKKNITVAAEPTADEQEKLTKMNAVKDKDFNEEWLEHQVSCHKDAVSLFKDEADDGKDVDLKDFANRTLPTLKAHLETAKRLEAKY
jgi:putative membrane protein